MTLVADSAEIEGHPAGRPLAPATQDRTDEDGMTIKELLDQLADAHPDAPIVIRPFERKADEPLLARCGIRELHESRQGEIVIDVEEM